MGDVCQQAWARQAVNGDPCRKKALLTELYYELRQAQKDIRELKVMLKDINNSSLKEELQ